MSRTGAETLPVDESRHSGSGRRREPYLVAAFECDHPLSPPWRHRLAGLDAVSIGRGDKRTAVRRSTEGERSLELKFPDDRMSSTHADLIRELGVWSLHDCDSRNGVFVNGARRSTAELESGDIVEMGHTIFLFEEGETSSSGEPADLDGASLESLPLATLNPSLSTQLGELERVASTQISVVITGESGTGKEVTARAVHELSNRPGQFVAVNCGAIPGSLIETELFGYRKGAFSGATEDRQGLIRAADKGTLFLDEIGDLPLASQTAFLRVIQELEVTPVGATRSIAVDLRVVAATHRSLDALVEQGKFRADLLARISGYTLRLPPLRERKADLGLLIAGLLRRYVGADAEKVRFSTGAARALFRYDWPMNVRELEKCLQTACVVAGGARIESAHLPREIQSAASPEERAPVKRTLTDQESARREQIIRFLRDNRGSVSATARSMGKARSQLQRWLKVYGIDPRKVT
jgi:DNA-binding NtrC family response regulator